MQVVKTYKYKIRNLSASKAQRLSSWLGACRYVYNLALETKIHTYRSYGGTLSKFDLIKQLPELKKEADWIKDVQSQVLQDVLKRLENAYQKFFKGGGFPRWAKKYKYNSITFPQSVKHLGKGKFSLPKLGVIGVFYSRPIPEHAEIKTATIIKEANGFHICITFKTTLQAIPKSKNHAIGIDWGVVHFATTSEGRVFENPNLFQQYSRQLRIEHRSLARKKKGGSNFRKQARKLSKLQSKIARIRNDFQHKVSTELVRDHSFIAVEALQIRNMTKSAKGTAEEPGKMVKQKAGLNRAILDTAPGMFMQKLEYKSLWYGSEFVKVPANYSSQQCNSCGHVAKENRQTQANFHCFKCGNQENADVNAARNILARAMASTRERRTLVHA